MYHIFSFIVVISIIVFIHELGHYIVARMCGVSIESFSIGFGKAIFSFTDKHNTKWKFSWLPFGGYVAMKGEKESSGDDKDKTSFCNQSSLNKILIALAGPFANYVLSFILFSSLLFVNGIKHQDNLITNINESSIEYSSGLRADDRILLINDSSLIIYDDISHSFDKTKEKQVFQVRRGDEDQTIEIMFPSKDDQYNINFSISKPETEKVNLLQAMGKSSSLIQKLTVLSFKSLIGIFKDKSQARNLAGPLQIAKISGDIMKLGLANFISFISFISIGIGFMNLLPIPAVTDGGLVIFYLVEMISGKKISKKAYEWIYSISVSFMLLLAVFVFVNDILKIFFHR